MIKKIVCYLLSAGLIVAVLALTGLLYVYKPVTSGVLYLEKAHGEAEVLRETDTSIPHIYASNEKMAVYTEGYLHAQERLWQMERLRLTTQGRLSEIMGEKTIGIDKFFRTIGLHRSAIASVKNMNAESLSMLQAYADGVNDYAKNIGGSSGLLMPPEFILLGIKEFQPWQPVDTVCIFKLLNFHLSWNWGQDLMRDVLEKSGLGDLVEEIFPFTAEFSHNLVTIIDKEDIMGTQHWSDQSLVERYYQSKGQNYKPKLSKSQLEKERLAEQERIRVEKLAAEEADRKKRAEEERLKKDREEQARKLQEEQERKRKLQEEEDRKKKAEEQERVRKEQETRRLEEEKKKEEAAKKKADEEAAAKKQAEEEAAKKKAEEEAAAKKKAEEEAASAQKKATEEAAAKQKAEQEAIAAKKKADEEAAKKKADEEAARLRKENEEKQARIQAEAKAAEEAATKKKAEEEAAAKKKQKEEEEKKEAAAKKEKEEAAAKKVQEESAAKKAQEEAAQQQAGKPNIEDVVVQKIDDNFASNNWVIHGNYTKTGKPLLAGDPHLGNQLPSHWYLMEMTYGDVTITGATHPGTPYHMFGTTPYMSWAITSALTDLSDLYKEKISNDGKQYQVDGEWKDLKVVKEQIKVKGRDQPIEYDIKFTHRGPLMNIDLLQGAEVLFSEGLPSENDGSLYSFAWTGSISEETTTDFLRQFQRVKSVKEVFAEIDKKEMFSSVPQNLIMGFADGDIAYFLANTMPIRKSQKPYTGCRVLDGTKSDDDWIGYVKPRDLPRVINPKKGFIVTANNRQMPDNVNIDVGATITSTIRAQRITELIQKGINANHKFDFNDMLIIQNDTVDLMARDIVPLVTKLGIEMLNVLSPIHSENAQEIIGKLAHWYGDMSENSVGATVFATWQFNFYNSLFKDQIKDASVRLSIVANYPFIDYFQRMLHTLIEDPDNAEFNRVCKNGYPGEYRGSRHCMYNIARAMNDAYEFLIKNVSPNSGDWMWKHVHVNEYPHVPLSFTPLKPFVHKEVPIGGNANTVKVSKYSYKRFNEMKAFKSTHTPNYKTVVQFADNPIDFKLLYSFDGGQSGNFLSSHYFDFNAKHSSGDLMEAAVGRSAVELKNHQTLWIKQTVKKSAEQKDSSEDL